MSFDRNDPAYPSIIEWSETSAINTGLTKREAFIKAAITGLTSASFGREKELCIPIDEIIDRAIYIADGICDKLEKENQ